MCLLEICIGDYAEKKVQNWLLQNQWVNLYGKNLSNTDIAYAMSVSLICDGLFSLFF